MDRIKFMLFVIIFTFGSNYIFSQTKNRISVQTGLFHNFFDKTPIINTELNSYKRVPRNLFKGMFIDSKGIQYQRFLNDKSSISFEFMDLNSAIGTSKDLIREIDPMIYGRSIKTINITHSRKVKLSNQFDFIYGGGINYLWGYESVYLYSLSVGWGWESRFHGYYRNDWGLNLRSGIEYTPIKNLTLFTNFDFLGILFMGAEDLDGNNAEEYYIEKYGRTNIPSRFDLSWRFGVGFNF